MTDALIIGGVLILAMWWIGATQHAWKIRTYWQRFDWEEHAIGSAMIDAVLEDRVPQIELVETPPGASVGVDRPALKMTGQERFNRA